MVLEIGHAMSLALPPQIAGMLQDLGLADSRRLRHACGHVRRLGRRLPQFESVWVDALAQCGIITRWQAGELSAGRVSQLRLGPYVALEPLTDCLYAPAYRARHVESGEYVRLVAAERNGRAAREAAGRLRELVEAGDGLATEHCVFPIAAGQVEQDSTPTASLTGRPETCRPTGAVRLWIAAPWIPGLSAADWLIAHGRMPAVAVEEIARAMVVAIADLHTAGLCHGDIAASSVWLASDGRVVLPMPGVRGVLRPEEGYSRTDLLPEAYDYLAPERVAQGTPPDAASDLYACGCVWWHLLCGRAPLGGGDSLMKLRAAHEARIPDPRELAPETPAVLAEAILACTRPEPERRPRTAAELATLLGAPTSHGRRLLGGALRAAERPGLTWPSMRPPVVPRRPWQVGQATAMGIALAAALLVAAWPIYRAVREKSDDAGSRRPVAAQPERAEPPTDHPPAHREPLAGTESDTQEGRVVPAAYLAELGNDGNPLPMRSVGPSPSQDGADDLNLPAEERIIHSGELDRVERLELRPGQRVAGPEGARMLVLLPSGGLHVVVAGVDPDSLPVRFEAIDFVWDHAGGEGQALVGVAGGNVRFRNCTFRALSPGAAPPVAVRWRHAAASHSDALALPSGTLRFDDCVFDSVAAALDREAEGAVRVEFHNVLHLGPGPLVHSAAPRADESMHLVLEQVTLRGAASLWRCRNVGTSGRAGRILVRAERSVFAPAEGGALLLFDGEGDPVPVLHNLTWEGEGALVTPGIPVVVHRRSGGAPERLDDTDVAIAGLVLSQVEFAGPPGDGPLGSRLLRWNAPLRTADAPGCNPEHLPVALER